MPSLEQINYRDSDIIGSRIRQELPKIRLVWARRREPLDFMKAMIYLILGKKGSGKSALLELLSLYYPKIIDLFGSRDDEGLAYCRKNSPIDNILLIHGDNVDLDCSWDTTPVSKLTYKKILDYEVVIPSFSFFSGNAGRFVGINKLMSLFWERRKWKKPIFVGVREASSFIYSRVKQEGVNMKMAKSDFIFWQREMRHFGYSLGIDTIRWTSIDKEMRDLADWLVIKKVGPQGIPDDLDFLYRYIDPMSMAGLPPDKFMLLTENASIAWGQSDYPAFHKEEGVDLLEELGIQISYGEEIEESSVQRIGDEEHEKIIRLYSEENSMSKISKNIHRSAARVHDHIHKHNKAVMENGFCNKCRRVRSDLADIELYIPS